MRACDFGGQDGVLRVLPGEPLSLLGPRRVKPRSFCPGAVAVPLAGRPGQPAGQSRCYSAVPQCRGHPGPDSRPGPSAARPGPAAGTTESWHANAVWPGSRRAAASPWPGLRRSGGRAGLRGSRVSRRAPRCAKIDRAAPNAIHGRPRARADRPLRPRPGVPVTMTAGPGPWGGPQWGGGGRVPVGGRREGCTVSSINSSCFWSIRHVFGQTNMHTIHSYCT